MEIVKKYVIPVLYSTLPTNCETTASIPACTASRRPTPAMIFILWLPISQSTPNLWWKKLSAPSSVDIHLFFWFFTKLLYCLPPTK